MALTLVGTLPVSALNVGLVAALPGLTAQVAKLQADISGLSAAAAAQIQIGLNPPNVAIVGAALTSAIAGLPLTLTPTLVASAGLSAKASVLLQIAPIAAQLALVGAITGQLELGLQAGSLSLWNYSGPASGFGPALDEHTATGWGGVSPNAPVQGLVIATESLASWQSFSNGFTGLRAGATTAVPQLRFVGTLGGGQVNTGVLAVKVPLDAFLALLGGEKANLEGQLELTLGVGLPNIDALVASLKAVTPGLLLSNFAEFNANIGAEVGALNTDIDATLKLVGGLQADLSAGGLAFWSYSGAAADFGLSLRGALVGGVPSGSGPDAGIYGVALASQAPDAWAAFGSIFRVG